MKNCPFCAEEIQEQAIKCRFCNQILVDLSPHIQREVSVPKERDDKLVSINELSGILNVPKSWIYQRTRLGQNAIPHLKMGKYLRFDPQTVKEFFNTGSINGRK